MALLLSAKDRLGKEKKVQGLFVYSNKNIETYIRPD